MITVQSTVSEMKLALLKLGCSHISATVSLVKNRIFVTVRTSHPKIGDITVDRDFTPAQQYLLGPMQPVYWEIYQRVLDAITEGPP